MIIPGLNSVTFRNLTVNEIVDLCYENNVGAIEWGGDLHVKNIEEAKYALTLCKSKAIECPSFGSYYRVGTYGPDYMPHFIESLEIAKQLESTTIRVWAYNKATVDVSVDSNEYKEIVKELAQICEFAKKDNISISFEHHQKTLTDDAKRAVKLIEDTGSDNLFMYWQAQVPLNFQENLEALSMFKPYITNLHICNQTANGYLPFKDIKDNFTQYLSVVKQYKKIYAYIEFVMDASIDAFREDIVVLKDIIKEIEG